MYITYFTFKINLTGGLFMDGIHTRLKDLRVKAGYSRLAVAEIYGIKERTVGAYERGELKAPPDYIELISIISGWEPEYILDGRSKSRLSKLPLAVKKLLFINKITHSEFLNKTAITSSELESILANKTRLDSEIAFKICEAYKLKPSEFGVEKIHPSANFLNVLRRVMPLEKAEILWNEDKDSSGTQFAKTHNEMFYELEAEGNSIEFIKNAHDSISPRDNERLLLIGEIVFLLPKAPSNLLSDIKGKLEAFRN